MNRYEKSVWLDSYNLDNTTIDQQHKELFEHIDDLLISIYEYKESKVIQGLFEFLDNYMKKLFHTEEVILIKINYPSIKNHIKEHNAFIRNFQSIKDDYYAKGIDVVLVTRIEKEIKEWWKEHILNKDMEYKQHIKNVK